MKDLKIFHRNVEKKIVKELVAGEDWGINCFPDKQNQFWIKEEYSTFVTIKIRINTPVMADLALQIARTVHFEYFDILYMYGARCDKLTAKDRAVCPTGPMYADLIAAWGLSDSVRILDCHFNLDLLEHKVLNIEHSWAKQVKDNKIEALLFPDASAAKRYKWVDGCEIPKYFCTKERDQVTGEIIKHEIPEIKENKILIVDDLCDGGRSFLDLSSKYPKKDMSLAVTHGIFSAGIEVLTEKLSKIFGTNSYADWVSGEKFEVVDAFELF